MRYIQQALAHEDYNRALLINEAYAFQATGDDPNGYSATDVEMKKGGFALAEYERKLDAVKRLFRVCDIINTEADFEWELGWVYEIQRFGGHDADWLLE